MTVTELTPRMEQASYDKSPEAMAVAALTVATEDLLTRNEEAAARVPEGEYSSLKYTDMLSENGDHVRRSENYNMDGVERITATTTADNPTLVSYERERGYSGGAKTVDKWTNDSAEVSSVSRDSRGVEREEMLSIAGIERDARNLEEQTQIAQEAAPQKKRTFGRGVLNIFRRNRS